MADPEHTPTPGLSTDPNPTPRPINRNPIPRPVDPRTLPAPSTPPNRPLPLLPHDMYPTPTLETVTQPGTTTVQPPADLKARIKESYDAIAAVYDRWTLTHRTQRLNYATRLIQLLAAAAERKLEEAEAARARRRQQQQQEHPPPPPPPPPPPLPPAPKQQQQEAQAQEPERNGVPHVSFLKHKHALDIGCGSGVPVIEVLLAKDMDVIGVDISATQIAMAKNHFPSQRGRLQAVWVEKDMMELRYPPCMFDAIVAVYSLIHLPREEQTVMLHRIAMWLKPGGMMMVNFGREDMEGEVVEHWLGQEKGWMYRSSWGEEKTMQIIEGFEDIEVLVKEVTEQNDPRDATFVWVIARKKETTAVPAMAEAAEAAEEA